MLTDIFANRYATKVLWPEFTENDRRFLVQSFRIISEQLFPFYRNGKEDLHNKEHWSAINNKLSMELGLEELSKSWFAYTSTWNGNTTTQAHQRTVIDVCKNFMLAEYDHAQMDSDVFMKERISLVEIAFRQKEEELIDAKQQLPNLIKEWEERQTQIAPGMRYPGSRQLQLPRSYSDSLKANQARQSDNFRQAVDELNTRIKQAGYRLDYHNGIIQLVDDDILTRTQVEQAFWSLVRAIQWKNVDIDMKEAIDRRDNGGRDPALYAAKALESTIKIISDIKKWTHGGEKGAGSYIDNLSARKNGNFISSWEADILRKFFGSVRNPLGHGPGGEAMPALNPQQTDWAIEFCMIWIKSLIRRH